MSETLKPCPLCASKAEFYNNKLRAKIHVTCSNVGCPLYVDAGITPDVWNTRPLEDAMHRKLEDAKNFIIPDEETYRKIMWNTLDRAVEIEEKRIEQQKLDLMTAFTATRVEEEHIEQQHQETGLYFDSEVE